MKQTLYEYSLSMRSIHKYIDLVKMAYRTRPKCKLEALYNKVGLWILLF